MEFYEDNWREGQGNISVRVERHKASIASAQLFYS